VNLRQLNRILLQTLLLPIVALLFVAGVLTLQIRKAETIVARMHAASDNISTATLIGQLTVNEENGVRGYQLTGDPAFLQSYTAAQAPLQANFAILRKRIARSGGDPSTVDELVLAHDTWRIAFAEPIIQSTSNGTDTRDITLNLRAQQQMDHVIGLIARIIYAQQGQRSQIMKTWRHEVNQTLEILVTLALLIGAFIGISARNRLHQVSEAFQSTLEAVRANAQLTYESEQRLRTMLTSIGEAIIVCDRRGRIELLNPIAEQLTGWRHAEALHEPLDKIFRLVNEVTRVRIESTGESFPQHPQQEITSPADPLANHPILIRRNGTEIPIEESEAPILDRTGKVAGVVIVFRDITEQRRAQVALVATEKLAVTGRLAATLAHEIHNPLDSVINLLYLLSSDPTPEETIQFLDLATKEVHRVSQISRAMLGMYRESKEPVAVNVQEMLDSILLLMHRQLREAQVKLHTEFAPGAVITGYPAELRQVFLNLIANAAEASAPNNLVILRTKIAPERRRNLQNPEIPPRPTGVEISIADNGSGIATDTLQRLFQPFFTTKGEHGTGLGLWVSRGIIEKHNGTIEIQSSISPDTHGTTVTVFLPRGNATV
jgi:PAS domain S-box-containing protein